MQSIDYLHKYTSLQVMLVYSNNNICSMGFASLAKPTTRNYEPIV